MSQQGGHGLLLRLCGAAVSFVLFCCLLVSIGIGLEIATGDARAWRYVSPFVYSSAAFVFAGWKWPAPFVRPFRLLAGAVARRSTD